MLSGNILWCVFGAKMITRHASGQDKHASGMNRHASGQNQYASGMNEHASGIIMQAVRTNMQAVSSCKWSEPICKRYCHASGQNEHTVDSRYSGSLKYHLDIPAIWLGTEC